MDDLDVERLIDEVRKKKSIWDTSTEEYKNRNVKKIEWNELCTVFYPNFDELGAKERANIGKL